MPQSELIALVNLIFLLVFVLGCVLAFLRLLFRVVAYRHAHWKRPDLLNRDLTFFSGLVFSFVAILLNRVFGWFKIGDLVWNIITGIPAIVGLWWWVYYEYFKIDHVGNLPKPKKKRN